MTMERAESQSLVKDSDEENEEKDRKLCPNINRTLLPQKAFYFFYFSAWGSLLPYLALYFKQMTLSPTQVGFLMGVKPFVNFFAVPLWGAFVDKCKQSKTVLLISICVMITSTFSLSLIEPATELCPESILRNASKSRREADDRAPMFIPIHSVEENNVTEGGKLPARKFYLFDSFMNDEPWPLTLVMDSTHIIKSRSSSQLFFLLFLIMFVGTTIAAPALTLVDTLTLQKLGDQKQKYGKQRLWGSLGWGLAAFIVGAAVSATHQCPNPATTSADINYTPCFYTFAVLLFGAFITATQFNFSYESSPKTSSSSSGGSVLAGLKQIAHIKYLMFLFCAFFFGSTKGIIKTFLFWHLKDLGGTQILFSFMTAINCVAEVTMYFLSTSLIGAIGPIKVIYIGLAFYGIICFYYSFLRSPWYVLPVEVLPGITGASVWAAMLYFVAKSASPGARTTLQGVLHGVHWGLGYGMGEVIGGYLVSYFGTAMAFIVFGTVSLLTLVAYAIVNNAFPDKEDKEETDEEEYNP